MAGVVPTMDALCPGPGAGLLTSKHLLIGFLLLFPILSLTALRDRVE